MSKFSDKHFKAANGESSALRQLNFGKSLLVLGIIVLPVNGGGWIFAIIIWIIAIFLMATATESTIGDYAKTKQYENFEEWLKDNQKYYDGMYIEDIKAFREEGKDFITWLSKQSPHELKIVGMDGLYRTWTRHYGITLDLYGKIISYPSPTKNKIIHITRAVKKRLDETEKKEKEEAMWRDRYYRKHKQKIKKNNSQVKK